MGTVYGPRPDFPLLPKRPPVLHCTKCNNPPVKGQCTMLFLYNGPLLYFRAHSTLNLWRSMFTMCINMGFLSPYRACAQWHTARGEKTINRCIVHYTFYPGFTHKLPFSFYKSDALERLQRLHGWWRLNVAARHFHRTTVKQGEVWYFFRGGQRARLFGGIEPTAYKFQQCYILSSLRLLCLLLFTPRLPHFALLIRRLFVSSVQIHSGLRRFATWLYIDCVYCVPMCLLYCNVLHTFCVLNVVFRSVIFVCRVCFAMNTLTFYAAINWYEKALNTGAHPELLT